MRCKHMILGVGLAAGVAACSADGRAPEGGSGSAVLTVVGNKNVTLGTSWEHEVEVRYHDGYGNPLAGVVEFDLQGHKSGAWLRSHTKRTDDQGLARVTVAAGERGDADFVVTARAPNADPVEWQVDVSESNPPLRLSGEYVVDSELTPMESLPREVETVVGQFRSMSDDELDPAAWFIDRMIERIEDNESLVAEIEEHRPALDQAVNDALLETSPELATELEAIADRFEQAAGQFGTTSVLRIGVSDPGGIERTGPVASHRLTGMSFRIDGDSYKFATGVNTEAVAATEVRVETVGLHEVEIGQHELPLRYGHMLLSALDQVILPVVDSPHTDGISGFLTQRVDCRRVGQLMHDRVLETSPDLYKTLCDSSVEYLGRSIEDELVALDAEQAMLVEVEGQGVPRDFDDDGVVDLVTGSWDGMIQHDRHQTGLSPSASSFRAERLGAN